MFTNTFHKNSSCIFVDDISQYFMKCCTSMSYISKIDLCNDSCFSCFSPPLSHRTLTASPGRSSEQPLHGARGLLAALLAIPILASSLASCSLIIAQSCFVSLSLMSWSRFSCFSILTACARELFFSSMFDHCLCTLVLCGKFLPNP